MIISILLGVMSAIAVWVLLFKPLFGNMEEFCECVKFWFMPDIISAFRGEWTDDVYAEMRLFLWLCVGGIVGLVVGFGVYHKFFA